MYNHGIECLQYLPKSLLKAISVPEKKILDKLKRLINIDTTDIHSLPTTDLTVLARFHTTTKEYPQYMNQSRTQNQHHQAPSREL